MVVENYMITERWKEEIELLKTEMERFLVYYSKAVLPQLLTQINKIYEKIGNSTGKFYKLSVDHITDKFGIIFPSNFIPRVYNCCGYSISFALEKTSIQEDDYDRW